MQIVCHVLFTNLWQFEQNAKIYIPKSFMQYTALDNQCSNRYPNCMTDILLNNFTGDICKQKMPPNKNGMAYGWKRSLRGKSYGFFPVSHVQIFHGDKPSILRSLSLDH